MSPSIDPNAIEGVPTGLRVQIGTGAGPTYTDRSTLIKRETVRIQRPKPAQEPGRMQFDIWNQGGGYTLKDFDRIRADDPWAIPSGLWTRYFAGIVITHRDTVDNNINLVQSVDAADYNWYFEHPPAMPLAPLLVGAPPVWLPTHRYFVNDVVQPGPGNSHRYKVQSVGASGVGMSGETQPSFPTGTGATVTEGIIGPPDTRITWVEFGSSLVTDVTVINQVLDLYYPSNLMTITRSSIANLIASVPSIEIGVDWTPQRFFQELAKYVTSTRYFEVNPSRAPSTPYSLNNLVEPPTPNGFVYRCTQAGNTSAGTPSYSTVIGQVYIDGTTLFVCDHRIGRAAVNVPYVLGQRIEPQSGEINGLYYQVIAGGTSSGSLPTGGSWSTTIGAVVSFPLSTVKVQVMGPTSVDPAWSFVIPNDNAPHTASWDPDFHWYDTTAGVGTSVITYSDRTDLTSFPTEMHYSEITVNREGNEYANRYYVWGRNNSFNIATNLGEIANKGGLVVAKVHIDTSDTGPGTNEECLAVGTDLLALSLISETVQLKARDPVDTGVLAQISYFKIKNDLLRIDPATTKYPVVDATLDFSSQVPTWNFQLGQAFLTDRETITSRRRGGRQYVTFGAPPSPATWPSDFVLSNDGNPETQLGRMQIHWRTGGEANLNFSHVQMKYGSENYRREVGMVSYPRQDAVIDNMPIGEVVTFYVCTIDINGRFMKDENGNPLFTVSPPVTVLGPDYFLDVPNPSAEIPNPQDVMRPLYWTNVDTGGGIASRVFNQNQHGHFSFMLQTFGGSSDQASFRSAPFSTTGIAGVPQVLRFIARKTLGTPLVSVTVAYYSYNPATHVFVGVDGQNTGNITLTSTDQEYVFALTPSVANGFATIQIINLTPTASTAILDDISYQPQRRPLDLAQAPTNNGMSLVADNTAITGMSFKAPPTLAVLTNRSGSTVNLGDVVIIDNTTNLSFTTTTTSGFSALPVCVVQETIANNATGVVMLVGQTQVNCNASITRGNYLCTNTTAKRASALGPNDAAGAFAVALEGGTSTPLCEIWSPPHRLPFTHGADHTTSGSDPIPVANGLIGGLESAADKTRLDTTMTFSRYQRDYATTAYTLTSEPTSDTTVKRDNGSTDMSVLFSLSATTDVILEFFCRLVKDPASSGRSRYTLYDNGSVLIPTAGRLGFQSIPAVDSDQYMHIRVQATLSSGSHTITIRHQASYTTAQIQFWERYLTAEIIG